MTRTGSGIDVVQVEVPVGEGYLPDSGNAGFLDKAINGQSGGGGASWHATMVGLYLYGLTTSMTPGIASIDVYEFSDWLLSGFLRNGSGERPQIASLHIINHSWVAECGSVNQNAESPSINLLLS